MTFRDLSFPTFAALICILLFSCSSEPKTPQEEAFSKANSLIFGSSNGIFHGDTPADLALAESYSSQLEMSQKLNFTGGKENRIFSMTGEHFLTYCKTDTVQNRVLFLVHVPQLKRYEDDAKDALMDMCWLDAAYLLEENGFSPSTYLCIGLRGSMFYKCTINGKIGGEPNKFSGGIAQSTDEFEGFF
ncbi:MAG: hypothetical protein H6581_26740 [Bacteroidia bacterium]|nr:hypothetical protein [Bacteroidia bacterium]